MNGIELFEKIYNDELSKEECIKIIHPQEENHFLFRKEYGDNEFEYYELLSSLLFKDYKFEIVNQKIEKAKLKKEETEKKIKELSKQIKELQETIDTEEEKE